MEQFNLQEYLKNPNRKIITRDGRSVRIVCTDMKTEYYPIIALIENLGGKEFSMLYTPDGISGNSIDSINLFFAPIKKEGWITVCKDGDDYYTGGTEIYSSESEAVSHFRKKFDSIKTVKIEWEE